MAEMPDREFVEWMRTPQSSETQGGSRSIPNIGRLKALSGVSDLVHFQPIISMVHIAILRLDLADARAQVAALTAERDATDEKHDQIRRIAEAVWNGLNEKTLAHIARLEAELAAAKRVIDASRCIRHWHDSGPNNEGMVVSAEHVRALWITIADYDAARSPEGTEGKDKDEGI